MQVKEVKVSAQAMLPSSSVITFTLGALSFFLDSIPSFSLSCKFALRSFAGSQRKHLPFLV